MTEYLFLITIGPVQSFIAQARKTQDLYAGSYLLSYLIDFAIKELKKIDKNCEIIFPADNVTSKPNRFIAIVKSENITDIGKKLENQIVKNLETMSTTILKKLKITNNSSQFLEKFNNQLNNFLQIYWLALPLENSKYHRIYPEIEKQLGSIKNIKIFNQLKEAGRKCSLCGERNALIYKKTFNGKKPAYIDKDAIELNGYKLSPGEALCAVCFIKRFGEKYFSDSYEKNFPSLANIATMDWLKKIEKNEQTNYEAFFNNFDPELYYEENLREGYLKKYDHLKDANSLKEAKSFLDKLYKKYGKPSKYYALIMLDGDNMGKWLSGEFLEDKSRACNIICVNPFLALTLLKCIFNPVLKKYI